MLGRRAAAFVSLGIALIEAVAVLAVAELTVRIAGCTPVEIPASNGKPPPDGVRIDPLLGPRPRPSWSGPWHQASFLVATDEHGFRTAGSASVPGQGARVALLGDSCTFGWRLDTEDTYAAGIARIARADGQPVEILNAGFPGDSAAVGLHLLVDRVLPLDPDVVVLAYSGNNAFRFSRVSDKERLGNIRRKRLALRLRLLELADAWMESMRPRAPHPRDAASVRKVPIRERRRVLDPADFEAALESMIALVREHGSRPVLLLFPRALEVSDRFSGEDPVVAAALVPEPEHLVDHMLQYSCLDPRSLDDPYRSVRAAVKNWRAVFPADDPELQEKLRLAARAHARNDLQLAEKGFTEAVELDPESPLALYDLGATQIDRGEVERGMALLARAEALSCNVFLQYQVIVRRVASKHSVPLVDLMLVFQAQPAGPLYIDPAHPSPEARDVIASAAWRVIEQQLAAPAPASRN